MWGWALRIERYDLVSCPGEESRDPEIATVKQIDLELIFHITRGSMKGFL